MSETFLYLTTIGHKSGNPHDIEIWYVENNGAYYLCSEGGEKSHWVQNIRAHPQVTFSVGTREDKGVLEPVQAAIARPITAESDKNLHHIVTQLFNGKYGWSQGLLVEIKGEQE
jgi:deazaflavin-dependent oxidoreductase (nitroreductase family)